MAKPTLGDVARRAHCSVSAASNILHGRASLYSEELVRRVLQAAQELGYRPKRVVHSLARATTHTLALVLDRHHPPPTRNPFAHHVLDGILETLEPRGYSLKIIMTSALDGDALWRCMREGAHDGALLLSPEIGSRLLEWRARCSLPVIVVGATIPDTCGLPCIDVDNEAGMRQLTRWVIEQGHRAVGYVGGNPRHWSAQQRERAFRNTLAEMGIPIREEWMLAGRYSVDSGVEAARQLLQLPHLPTAVICANDLMAVGLIQELQLHGVRVPQEVSVAGFDDEPQVQSLGYALTTIRSPMHEIGREATERLLECIEQGEHLPARALLLPGLLIVRSSVRPCCQEAERS